MANIQNYRDQVLQATSPRLIKVPNNRINLVGTGNTFEVRGNNTSPAVIEIRATPQGHLTGLTCSFTKSGTGHTLSVPSPNYAVVTGDVNGSDIFTVTATITYQGLTYDATYTINKIASSSFTPYELDVTASNAVYDATTSQWSPTSITANATTSNNNGITFIPYSGRFTIHLSSNFGVSWGSAQYTSSANESSYTYDISSIPSTTSTIRFRLHTAGETPSDSNVLHTTYVSTLIYGNAYSGSGSGGFGKLGRAVFIDTGDASLLSVYGPNGYLASSLNYPNYEIACEAVTIGYQGTKYYRWLLDDTEVSGWGSTNNIYTYTRKYDKADMPDILKVQVADGYTGSVYAEDYVTFKEAGTGVVFDISNEYHTISFDINNVGDYTDSGTNFYGYEGTNSLTFNDEANTYPAEVDVGTYNVERSYLGISSGGNISGQDSSIGTVPDHTNFTGVTNGATYAVMILTFRARKLDGTTHPEVNKTQYLFKSARSGPVNILDSKSVSSFYAGSGLPNLVDFTDLVQTFWPGDLYNPILSSGGMSFGYRFSGVTEEEIQDSTFFIGSQIYSKLNGDPLGGLIIDEDNGGYWRLGVACDPMDHPVLFGTKVGMG